MKFIKPENKKHKITAAVCFSLLIHFAVAALLVFGLSSNLISTPKLNGINLVWVSLDTKNKNSGVAIQESRLEQPSPAVERAAPKQANAEKPEAAQIFAAIATTTKELTNTIVLAKYDVSGKGAKEQTHNITGYSANQTAGDKSNLNTVIALPLY
jgi:hypothetical protein